MLITVLFCGCSDSSGVDGLRFQDAGLLIVSIDTLRADRLGCYGNERGLTPNLDALAAEAVLFEDAYANSPKTASSHMSLFTSLPPTMHGVTNFSPRYKVPLVRLADNRLTLGQILEQEGYWNAAVASGANIQGAMGFSKGFGQRFSSELKPVNVIVMEALAVSEMAARQDKPPFLFVHTYQVHAPYVPPPAFQARFAPQPRGYVAELMNEMEGLNFLEQWKSMHTNLWDHKDKFGPEDAAYLSDLYDGEIGYTDKVLGKLFTGLRKKGLLDEMIVIVLSDHGEEFAEHGDYEHDQLYREHLHVPLIVRLPGGALGGTRVRGLTSLIDVMPTVLDLLDIEGPSGQMMGTSLVPAMMSGRTDDVPVLAERVMFADDYQATLRSRKGSLIFRAAQGTLEAHDLVNDADEKKDVAWEAPFFESYSRKLRGDLTGLFARRLKWDRESTGEAVELDEDALEELRQLGYLSGDALKELLPEGSPLDHWPESSRRDRR